MTAEQALPDVSVARLRQDARQLAAACAASGVYPGLGNEALLGTPILVDRWLTFRKEHPDAELAQGVLTVTEVLPDAAVGAPRGGYLRELAGGCQVNDRDFAELYAGSQVALEVLKPDIPSGTFEDDWRTLPLIYTDAVRKYVGMGAALTDVRQFLGAEFIGSRLKRTVGSLSEYVGGREPRLGFTRVETDPMAAIVWVARRELGAAPQIFWVEAGREHELEGRQDRYYGQKTIRLEPGWNEPITLSLALT